MRLIKLLTTTLFTLLSLPFSTATNVFPAIPTNNQLTPSFALQIVQEGMNILITTFNDPQNSFNVITNPIQRRDFLNQVLDSVDNLSSSLSQISSLIDLNIDFLTLNNINTEIDSLFNSVTDRIENYLLTNDNPYYMYDGFTRDILSQRLNVTYRDIFLPLPIYNISIEIPIVYTDSSNFDFTSIFSQIYSLPQFDENSINLLPLIMLKISNTNGVQLILNDTLVVSFPLPSTQEGFITFCGMYNEVLNRWIELPSNINTDRSIIACDIPKGSLQTSSFLTIPQNNFYTVSLFTKEDVSSDNNKAILILSIVIPSFFLIISGIVGWRYYKRRKEYNDISNSTF